MLFNIQMCKLNTPLTVRVHCRTVFLYRIANYINNFNSQMVTFVCRHCDATLKKKQTQNHRCRPTSFICIDCHNTFTAQDFKGHISCLTEFEKHWGEYAKPKQKSQQPSGENKNKQQPQLKPVQQPKIVEKEHEQNGKKQQQGSFGWHGWKNEIKATIRELQSERLKVEDLREKVLKRFRQFQPSSDMKQQQLSALFAQKLGKLKKIKLVTYIQSV